MSNPHTIRSKSVALTQNVLTKLADPAGARKLLILQNANASNFKTYLSNQPYAVSFDGTPDYVALDDGSAGGLVADTTLLASTTGTIKARIRIDSMLSADGTIFSVSDANANEYLSFGTSDAAKLTATLRTAAELKWTITVDTALATGTWYDVKLVHNGTRPIIYINHENWPTTDDDDTDLTCWFADLSNIDLARIGSLNTNGAGEAAGFIGDMAYFELADGLGFERDEIVKYEMLEFTGTTLDDRSGNDLDGTFGWTTAAPAWAEAVAPIILTGDTTNPGNLWFLDNAPITAVYALTTEANQTALVMEGF
jgi:hypothetical protein